MENYFCDGSTFRAEANQYKMVWKKNAERYKAGTEENTLLHNNAFGLSG